MMRTNKLYDGPDVDDSDILSVYVILNGSLGMTGGKAASQSYHCGWYASEMYGHAADAYIGDVFTDEDVRWIEWARQGRRVVVRLAETPVVFERVKRECSGHLAVDEGVTEVEHGAETAFVTVPYRRDSIPKVLTHKKLQLYRG